jgi:hypothetical protein
VWHLATVAWRLNVRNNPTAASVTPYRRRFIPLVRDTGAWSKVHHSEPTADNTLPAGTLQTYSKRGWCRHVFVLISAVHAVVFTVDSRCESVQRQA